ncbi:MAG: mechanosensitive ion channel [Gammaproteobacteria bacterium]|nr:mechanosensitive ion channel [Gammaproteobacteria bacterium]
MSVSETERNTVRRITGWLTLLVLAVIIPGPPILAAETPFDATFFPVGKSSSADASQSGEEWRALEQRFDGLEAALEQTEELSEEQLLRWQQEISALGESLAVHIQTLEARQAQLKNQLETLGPQAENEPAAISEQRTVIRERKGLVDANLAAYRLLQLQGSDLYKKLDAKRQQMLTEKFFARGQESFSLLKQHGDLSWRWIGGGVDFVVNRSGLQLPGPMALLNLAVMLLVALALGLLLRRKCFRWCSAKREERARFSLMLLAALGYYAPHLLAGATTAIFAALVLGAAPESLAYQLGTTLPLFFLFWALLHFLFRGNRTIEPLFSLPAAISRGLGRSLKLLVTMAYFGSLVAASDARQEISEAAGLLLRDVFVVAVVLCLFWVAHYLQRLMREHGIRGLYGVTVLLLVATLFAELFGYRNIAYWLLRIIMGSGFILLATWLAVHLCREFFAGFRDGRLWWQVQLRRLLGYGAGESMPWVGWFSVLSVMTVWIAAVYGLLLVWGISNETLGKISTYILEGFQIGSLTIIPVRVVIAVVAFAVLLALSGWLRRRMESVWLNQSRMERGSREAMVTITGYIGVAVAILVALGVAGVKFTNLAIIAGALSVGIGFGLQNIVNNFVSGLILLFERPVKTGDWIVVGTTEGYVKRISIRSTMIQTFDRADVIVPNSELISGQVTNWMLYDSRGRIRVPVGVAYGSDTQKVKAILLQVAAEHPNVILDGSMTEPKVLFLGFGDSSLNFELRAFIKNIDERLQVVSDINFAIDAAFHKAGVEIPFPQRDLHVRSWNRPQEDH